MRVAKKRVHLKFVDEFRNHVRKMQIFNVRRNDADGNMKNKSQHLHVRLKPMFSPNINAVYARSPCTQHRIHITAYYRERVEMYIITRERRTPLRESWEMRVRRNPTEAGQPGRPACVRDVVSVRHAICTSSGVHICSAPSV